MRIEKEKHKVNIICQDGSFIKGVVHINPGERLSDFINDSDKNFIVITNAEFYYMSEPRSFSLMSKLLLKRDFVLLNKSAIKLIEEAK
ncbi:MAG: hypothetical protein NC908_02885 [Candidatus Omnitrophica bacterium]|nr:hypothetical protein [Candidatus Omnitrophota bacterium]